MSTYYREVMAAYTKAARTTRAAPRLKRGFLIGQAAPRPVPGKTHHPLFPFPRNCAGERLFRMSGWTLQEWFKKLNRFNTIEQFPGKSGRGDAFPKKLAREQACQHMRGKELARQVCVFVGKANASAYPWHEGVMPEPLVLEEQLEGGWWGWMPHTSGIVQFWNKEENRDRARLFFDQVKIQLE